VERTFRQLASDIGGPELAVQCDPVVEMAGGKVKLHTAVVPSFYAAGRGFTPEDPEC
jgi:hypothetical protein